MGEEHDSWFKSAFGVDLGEAAGKIKDEALALADAAKKEAEEVIQDVKGAAKGGIGGAASGLAGAAAKAAAVAAGAAAGVAKKAAEAVGAPKGGIGGAASGLAAAAAKAAAVAAGAAAGVAKKAAEAVDDAAAGLTRSFPLRGSVGRGGKNEKGDVGVVQRALGIAADGQCGPQTIAAIDAFQRTLGQAKPDGRVDAGGATERALAGGATKPPIADEPSGVRQLVDNLEDLGGRVVAGVRDVLPGIDAGDDLTAASTDARDAAKLIERILAKIKAGADIGFEVTILDKLDMRSLLDAMGLLKRAGKLEAFADRTTSGHQRVGVAILTVRPEFDALWRRLVAGLNAADRAAVLERTPKNVKVDAGVEPAPPKSGGEEEEGGGSISIGPEEATVTAKMTFESKSLGSLGSTVFAVTLGPEGKLGEVEIDLTLIKQKLAKRGPLGPILDLEATLSLNSSAELSQDDARVVLAGVQASVKGEIAVRFKTIPVLRKVLLKLSVSGGSAGVSLPGLSLEIPIPGT